MDTSKVVSIIIGVLIGRMGFVTANTLIACTKWITCDNDKEKDSEWDEFSHTWKGGVLTLPVTMFIIVIIYAWYKRSLCIKYDISDGGQKTDSD